MPLRNSVAHIIQFIRLYTLDFYVITMEIRGGKFWLEEQA